MTEPARGPLVTVITPTYDVAPYIEEAVRSVLGQTAGDLEHLVVDDGSTDGTVDVVRRLAAEDPRLRLVEAAHGGSAAARNLGLAQARGTYVAFCDGDDRWHPDFLRRSLDTLTAAPDGVGGVFCASRPMDVQGRVSGPPPAIEPGDYDAARTLAGNCPPGNGSCLLIRRSCFEEAGPFDEGLRSGIDLDMWMRIHLHAHAPLLRHLAEPLVDWRTRPGAISRNEGARVDALAEIFARYDHVLSPQQRADSRRWPALLAYYAERDETARRWTAEVRAGDRWYFARGVDGVALGLFALLGPRAGRRLRAAAARTVAAPARFARARLERRRTG